MLTPDGTQLFNPVCRDCWSVPFKVQMYGWIKQTKTIIWQEERAYESKHLCGIPKMEGFEGSQGWLDEKKIHETLKSEKGIFMSEIYSTLFMIKVKHSQYIKQSLLLCKSAMSRVFNKWKKPQISAATFSREVGVKVSLL